MVKNRWFYKFLLWRENTIKEKHFVLIVSFLVGICTAASAIILKNLIHWIQHLLSVNFDADQVNYLYLLYPVVGILLSGLFVKYVVRDDISHGVTKILYAISQRKSRIKLHNVWSSTVASSVTIGFGGSVGAEAPIVLTGAAIGSNLGRLFRMEQKTLMLLVGCGAAGAIAGIFKAPIAGLVFVIEVLMLDLTMTSVLPLLITSVTAATVSYIFTGTEALFHFSQTEVFAIERIPYVLLLGIFCGLVSLYFTRVMNWIEGETLDKFLGERWEELSEMSRLTFIRDFYYMCHELRSAGIAHGDLSCLNIMVTAANDIRLVDYDSLYVSEMGTKFEQVTGGADGFQHPDRINAKRLPCGSIDDDNFSQLIIALSLWVAFFEPSITQRYGESNLLFLSSDLSGANGTERVGNLRNSAGWKAAQKYSSRFEHVRTLMKALESSIQRPVSDVPSLLRFAGREIILSEHFYSLLNRKLQEKASYCTACGHRFVSDDFDYCTVCGTKRHVYEVA